MSDRLTRFMLRAAPVRGEIVVLEDTWREILDRHTLVGPIRDCLGELSAAASLLAATLKLDGALVLQIQGDGPVALVVVECRSDGGFRATVKQREERVSEAADLGALVNANGRGRFAVTLDPSTRRDGAQPYQGIIPFDGDGVAEVIESYMRRSEQIPTRLWLAADARRATGLLLQRLPDDGGSTAKGSDPDAWNRVQRLAETLGRDEMLSSNPDQILHRLFWQETLVAFDQRPIMFRCDCTRERVAAMLRMLGRAEVDDIIAERGEIDVGCDYCNTHYRFDPVDAAAVFASGLVPGADTSH